MKPPWVGQRVQAHQRRDRRPLLRQRQLADQLEAVRGVQHDVAARGRQHGVLADVRHRQRP
jgi:hypothetical protein